MKKIETENHVKDIVRQWFDARDAYHFAIVQNGLGTHGIHDRLAAVPIVVTQEMVGKKIGVFVSVEAKKPGRRGEKDRGMSKHQVMFLEGVRAAGGLSKCVDGYEDLEALEKMIYELTSIGLDEGKELDEDSPLWLVNAQIDGLLTGDGAPEDHENVLSFLRGTGLPEDTVKRVHKAIVNSETATKP